MNKHTPGPWAIGERVPTARIDNARMIRPADHHNYEYGATAIIGTSEADACLIAAAPDLLDALVALLKVSKKSCGLDLKEMVKAREAIKKATGGKE